MLGSPRMGRHESRYESRYEESGMDQEEDSMEEGCCEEVGQVLLDSEIEEIDLSLWRYATKSIVPGTFSSESSVEFALAIRT